MLKKLTALLFALAAAASLAACQGGQEPNGTNGNPHESSSQKGSSIETNSEAESASASGDAYYSFQDASGEQITLREKPQRVAVLFSSFADVWETAGGRVDITVGESVERGFASEDVLLVDDGAGKTINQELLLSYEPDFVICSADLEEQVKTAEFLRKQGVPAAVFHVEEFQEYLDMLKICTDITGDQEAYETYGTQVREEVEAVLASVPEAGEAEQKRILFIRAGSKYSATKAKTAENNFVCVMLKELGTYNIAENAPILLDGLSQEEILMENPDYIFISTMGKEEAARAYMDSVLQEEAWQHLDAVKEGRYAYLPKELFQFKPNKRWGEAYRYLADLLYPKES